MSENEMILVETHGNVSLIRLNRPKALNALCAQLIAELNAALALADADDGIGAVVITGSERAFAAGADIKEMKDKTYPETALHDFIAPWETITRTRKPVIAAVAGFALGGGCELAMMCDFIVAADTARFGQPEINLGIIPGAGGTQRLTRAIGKAKAMDLVLTGRMMDAAEAERASLVSRVVPADKLVEEALAAAAKIAALSPVATAIAKQAVNRAFETTLAEGVRAERSLFLGMFGSADQREGMAAFVEKRAPEFRRPTKAE
jgi:enoyl-CoA hydratase